MTTTDNYNEVGAGVVGFITYLISYAFNPFKLLIVLDNSWYAEVFGFALHVGGSVITAMVSYLAVHYLRKYFETKKTKDNE
jgi:uncharacterized membrane protein YdjX (TVP38/TMEM64 family)